MKTVLTTTHLVTANPLGVIFLNDMNASPLVRIYPDGVVELRPGYSAEKVAKVLWSIVDPLASALLIFPGETGEALVTVTSYGKVTYRPGYRPDPMARELWETLGRLCPGVRLGEPVQEPCHPGPGFTGMWGTNASIDGYRPR